MIKNHTLSPIKIMKNGKPNNIPCKFIYLTTHEGETFYRDAVLGIRREVAMNFFGSMWWETYLATRTVFVKCKSIKNSSEYDSQSTTSSP